ncbi:MAG: hypothetical protein KatS3mg108_3000 [Isosphaeraceae bacterium]|jgi:hypothetical protein|nr:MAG: hypothetical protein KatS3mg108_3000 [Isosphaeraceae bacterium]
MIWVYCWMVALSTQAANPGGPTDHLRPPGWQGNPWGPQATEARRAGLIPPIPMTPAMAKWERWGKRVLRDGDIVFRLDDARALLGYFPFSRFIAQATASPFSHTGIVAIEEGRPFVYDTSAGGVRRQPFCVWVLDNIGPFGVRRLRSDLQSYAPGAVAYCRRVFEEQPPFDFEFDPDDRKLYCAEMTEKAFRSQGLELSEPIRIGDWENLGRYPVFSWLIRHLSRILLEQPISLDQHVWVPGNNQCGIWASALLETVHAPPQLAGPDPALTRLPGQELKRDLGLFRFVQAQIRRSLADAAVRLALGDRLGFFLERARPWW